jgi:DNA-binding transcriptional LysR family regulator
LQMDVVLDDRNIDLVQEGIHVALRMGNLKDSVLTARRIATAQRLIVGTPTYFEKHGEPVTPGDLVAHDAVIYDQRGGGEVWTFRRDGAEVAVAVKGRLQVTAAEGVRAAVLADAGLVVASEWMFAPELASGAVRPTLVDWHLPPIDVWAVFPEGRTTTKKARMFVEFVEEVLKPPRATESTASAA